MIPSGSWAKEIVPAPKALFSNSETFASSPGEGVNQFFGSLPRKALTEVS